MNESSAKFQERRRLLLVDDDRFLIEMYSHKFWEEGYEVATAKSVQDALDVLKSAKSFDIILADLVMPVADGFELLEKIKEEKLAEDAALIVLSNQSRPQDVERAESLGVDGYIVKANNTPSEVALQIKEIVQKKSDVL